MSGYHSNRLNELTYFSIDNSLTSPVRDVLTLIPVSNTVLLLILIKLLR